ncbi:MAG: acetylxylan esterase [Lentisphaerae bacterium]|nr:acetylxylan esterase [Lentisphaerota bacterium]
MNARILALLLATPLVTAAGGLPDRDLRGGTPKTTDTPWTFTPAASRADWEARAGDIREQILVSCGLWPMPERTPLRARVFDRVERDGYSIEKVDLQPWPGVHLGGNLFRPLGRGPGPFPAILNPHGHWNHGRIEDGDRGGIPPRCIAFARQGMIALSIDMIGYNDTMQFGEHRKCFQHPTNALWGISIMGLQTWNAVRALDFLASLPDADTNRLACTGASGGGTQTFMLGALDDRLAVVAPIVMVSHTMQGGCVCENAPGLRIRHFNVEIGAAAAPRPQILVAATGDWTRATMEVEGPAIASVYRHFDAADRFRAVCLPYGHNYNQETRENVYGWFGQWLRALPDASPIPEAPHPREPNDVYRLFPDGRPPAGALTEAEFAGQLVATARQSWTASLPPAGAPRDAFVRQWLPAWRHTLQVDASPAAILAATQSCEAAASATVTRLAIGRDGCGDRVSATLHAPDGASGGTWAVVAGATDPGDVVRALAQRRVTVLRIDPFGLTGAAGAAGRDYAKNHFTTYNRTDAQESVQDLLTAAAFARASGAGRVVVCGAGRAGLWAMLAAPGFDAVVADACGIDPADDQALLARDILVPCLRRLGGLEGPLLLAAPRPAYLHNTAGRYPTASLRAAHGKGIDMSDEAAGAERIADWIVHGVPDRR